MSEDNLRDLFEDAVADVAPRDRLGEIRRRTARSSARNPRRWALAVLGAGTATAAVVAAGALIGQLGPDRNSPTDSPHTGSRAVATYFLGDTPVGTRLFREFQATTAANEPGTLALDALQRLEADAGPVDPDYRTVWPADSFTSVTVGDDWIAVEVSDATLETPDGVAAADLALGVQQAVHTAEAAVGASLPVAFERNGSPADDVLGVPVPPQVARANDVAAPVNITDPVEGRVAATRFTARGTVAPTSDGLPTSVSWRLADERGDVVADDTVPVTGRTWSTMVSTEGLAPGVYVLSVTVPVGLGPPALDTRTVTVR